MTTAERAVPAGLATPVELKASAGLFTRAGLAIVLGLISWMGTARLVRGEVYSLKERDFVTAARAMGATDPRIITWHIWPNVLPIVIIILGIDIGGIILYESAISYLGL